MAAESSRVFGSKDYHRGALERLGESWHLLRANSYAGSVYLGGRAVEAMLRAVIWHNDVEIRTGKRSLETGHDPMELLKLVGNLGVLKQKERDDELKSKVQRVARLWYNNMRFAGWRKVDADWRRLGILKRKYSLKAAARDFYEDCSIIVRRCEALL